VNNIEDEYQLWLKLLKETKRRIAKQSEEDEKQEKAETKT
jgi:hypothetical protein